mgnify:CR=1 FL=1
MNIAGLRVKITIQKNETVTDKYGNHKSVWTDYFSCWASASKDRTLDEDDANGTTTEESRLNFTVRWSTETAAVNSKQYRILLYDQIYNIVSVDEQGFRRKSRKFITELAER